MAAARIGARALCARRFAGRRHESGSSGTLAKTGASAHSGTLAEAGTSAGRSAGSAARGVHGTASAGGSGSSGRAGLRPLARSSRTAVENGASPLESSSGSCPGGGGALRNRNRRSGVDGARSGLRHNHAARSGGWLRSGGSFHRWRGRRGLRRGGRLRGWSGNLGRGRMRRDGGPGDNWPSGRRGGNGRTRFGSRRGGAYWRLDHDGAGGRLGRDGWSLRRPADNGRCRARLRNNPARGRFCCFRFWGWNSGGLWSGRSGGLCRSRGGGARPCGGCGLLLLLL